MAKTQKQSDKNDIRDSSAALGMTKVMGVTGSARKVNKKPLYVVAGIVTLLIIGGWLIIGLKIGQKVYAEAAGHKIYKNEIDAIKKGNTDVSDKAAATVLADKYLSEALGKERGVTVGDQDMIAEYGPDVVKQKDLPYAWQSQRNNLFFIKLNQANQGTYSGKLLMANFSRNVAFDTPSLAEKKAKNPDLGNPAAIAADKKYAKDFITKLYNQLKAGQITWDQAIATEHADPVVGEAAYSTQTHSRSFSGPLSNEAILNASSVKKKIEALKPGELMKPTTVKATTNLETGDSAETIWLVVQMDKSKSGPGGDFQEYLAQAKKRLGYKINA